MPRLSLSILLSALLLVSCDTVPTTLDEERYQPSIDTEEVEFDLNVFDFDFLTREVFVSIGTSGLHPDTMITVNFSRGPAFTDTLLILTDDGQAGDILVADGNYDKGFALPDTFNADIDTVWTIDVLVSGEDSKSYEYEPEIPAAPVLVSIVHPDTLYRPASGLNIDTLFIEVSHPGGLDEVKDVSMMSLKPSGEYANNGQPIFLFDDGSSTVFFEIGEYVLTSGDHIANDGVYATLLPLDPGAEIGAYTWTFSARTWMGTTAEVVVDTVYVLQQPGALLLGPELSAAVGVFK